MKYLLLILFFASCTKEVSQPIQLRPPVRPKPVTVTMKFFKTSHAYVIGDTYGVQLNTSQVMKVDTHFYLEWKSGTEKYTLKPIIYANSNSQNHSTMLLIYGKESDVKLLRVEGDSTFTYTLKVVE